MKIAFHIMRTTYRENVLSAWTCFSHDNCQKSLNWQSVSLPCSNTGLVVG